MVFELIVLGTSGAVPAYGRFCSSQVLHTENEDFLIDCGEGCQMRLQRYAAGHARFRHIFISHLHGDHFYGLPGLLTSWALAGRSEPLTLYSPPGLQELLDHFLLHAIGRFPYPIHFRELDASRSEILTPTPDIRVRTLPLHHRVPTLGYRFDEVERPRTILPAAIARYQIPYTDIAAIKGGADFELADGSRIPNAELTTAGPASRSYAYCSDTRYYPELQPLLQDVDLLYHEATFLHELLEQAEETLHATAREAALMARAAGAGQLVLGHFSSRYADTTDFEVEARTIFPRTYAARDGQRFQVAFEGRKI